MDQVGARPFEVWNVVSILHVDIVINEHVRELARLAGHRLVRGREICRSLSSRDWQNHQHQSGNRIAAKARDKRGRVGPVAVEDPGREGQGEHLEWRA